VVDGDRTYLRTRISTSPTQAWRSPAAIDPVQVAIAGVTTACVVVFE
jgi:hypothetical protein